MRVQSPVEGFTGEVVGVVFDKGVAHTTSPAALAYFRRQGYGIGEIDKASTPGQDRVAARVASIPDQVGTKLRDAAVDPRPEDFLPPTNAGQADPHGPEVVAPEIHGSGPSAVTPGDVPDSPEAQEAKETAATVEAADVELELPKRNASGEDWRAYAVAQGMDPDEAAATSRDDLADMYHEEG